MRCSRFYQDDDAADAGDYIEVRGKNVVVQERSATLKVGGELHGPALSAQGGDAAVNGVLAGMEDLIGGDVGDDGSVGMEDVDGSSIHMGMKLTSLYLCMITAKCML